MVWHIRLLNDNDMPAEYLWDFTIPERDEEEGSAIFCDEASLAMEFDSEHAALGLLGLLRLGEGVCVLEGGD